MEAGLQMGGKEALVSNSIKPSRTYQVSHLMIGTAALQAANISIFVLLARWLPVKEFGLYRQLFLIHQILSALFFSAFPTSLLYFAGKAPLYERSAIVRRHLWLVLIIGITVILALWFGGAVPAWLLDSPELRALLWLFAPYTAAYMIYSLVTPTLITYSKTTTSIVFSITLGVLNSIPILWIAHLGLGLKYIVMVSTLSALAGALVAVLLILKITKEGHKSSQLLPLSEIWGYLWPLLLASGIGLVALRMDHIVVSNQLGPKVYAAYAVAAFEIPLFSMLQSSVSSVLLPQFSSLASTGNWQEISRLWRLALVRSAVIIFPVSAALIVLAEPFIELLFGAQYREAATIFRIYLLLSPIRIMTFGLVLRANGETKPDLYGSIGYLIAVTILALIGVKINGASGAMFSVVVATAGLALWLAAQTQRLTGGKIRMRDMYPLKVIVFFPLSIIVFWLILDILIVKIGALSALAKIIAGCLIVCLSISLGFLRLRKVGS